MGRYMIRDDIESPMRTEINNFVARLILEVADKEENIATVAYYSTEISKRGTLHWVENTFPIDVDIKKYVVHPRAIACSIIT